MVMSQGFYQSIGNGSLAIGKIVQFWYDLGKVQKSMKYYELDKLRKFTLHVNLHFIQTFVNYYPSSGLVFWNLCIVHSILYLQFSLLQSESKMGIFGPILGKKRYHLALGLGPYNRLKFTRKKSL